MQATRNAKPRADPICKEKSELVTKSMKKPRAVPMSLKKPRFRANGLEEVVCRPGASNDRSTPSKCIPPSATSGVCGTWKGQYQLRHFPSTLVLSTCLTHVQISSSAKRARLNEYPEYRGWPSCQAALVICQFHAVDNAAHCQRTTQSQVEDCKVVDSTPCRAHIFLSLVTPSCVSHCI